MRKVIYGVFGVLLLSVVATSASSLKQKDHEHVIKIVEAFKANNRSLIAEYVSYPLSRRYPIPPIKDKQEFLKRFDEVFDAELLRMIINSDISNDWSDMGYRGVMLGLGEIWIEKIEYDGKIKAINYQSALEKQIGFELIAAQRMTLHQSVRDFAQPVFQWRTAKYRIRVDDLGEEKYRYASWSVDKAPSEKPDLVLFDGEIIHDGSGGNHYYIFSNGVYEYICYVNVIGSSTMEPGVLEVSRNGERLLREPVVQWMR